MPTRITCASLAVATCSTVRNLRICSSATCASVMSPGAAWCQSSSFVPGMSPFSFCIWKCSHWRGNRALWSSRTGWSMMFVVSPGTMMRMNGRPSSLWS